VNRLVDRFGRTGFALLASLIWFIPMAAWAGSADLSPIDQTAYPKVALAIGLVMLVVWLAIISRLRRIPVSTRPHRFDLAQMTSTEKRWTLAAAAFATGLIAWLNGAATVDWAPLTTAVQQGKPGPTILAVALFAFAAVMVAGIAFSWRRANAAYRARGATHI
jgi:membrane protease YdiL (CAAX protease family)